MLWMGEKINASDSFCCKNKAYKGLIIYFLIKSYLDIEVTLELHICNLVGF
jgi:hypothetical protein